MFLKVEVTGFTDRLDMGYKIRSEVQVLVGLGPNQLVGQTCRKL